jgi:hypothetical protein
MGTNANSLPPEQQTLHLAAPEGARLYFSGPPSNVTGTIPLVNTGPDKQKIRTIAVSGEKLRGAANLPLKEIPFYARLHGGEQASLPASMALHAQTPPGKYDFQLTVGAKTLDATAQVTDVVDLRLDPSAITILAGADISYTRTFVAENAGNVPLPTGAQCEAPLFDSFDLISAMLAGLHRGDRKSAGSMALAFLNEWADLEVGTLITKRTPMILGPGQKVSVDLEFVLPAGLKPLRHYRANLQLYNATLSVDIYTTAKAGS